MTEKKAVAKTDAKVAKTDAKVAKTDAKVAKEEKAPKVEIIRGRMPLPIVAMIKSEDEGLTDGTLAAKYRTTVGKVSDIRKESNFAYIDADYVPNADMIAKALLYAEQLNDESVLTAVKDLKAGDAKDDERLAEKRKACRPSKSAGKTKGKTDEKVKTDEPAEKVKDEELAELTA